MLRLVEAFLLYDISLLRLFDFIILIYLFVLLSGFYSVCP